MANGRRPSKAPRLRNLHSFQLPASSSPSFQLPASALLLVTLLTALALGWLISLRFPFFPARGERLLLLALPPFILLAAAGLDALWMRWRVAGISRRARRSDFSRQPGRVLHRAALRRRRLPPAHQPHGRAGAAGGHGVRRLSVAGGLLAQLWQPERPRRGADARHSVGGIGRGCAGRRAGPGPGLVPGAPGVGRDPRNGDRGAPGRPRRALRERVVRAEHPAQRVGGRSREPHGFDESGYRHPVCGAGRRDSLAPGGVRDDRAGARGQRGDADRAHLAGRRGAARAGRQPAPDRRSGTDLGATRL